MDGNSSTCCATLFVSYIYIISSSGSWCYTACWQGTAVIPFKLVTEWTVTTAARPGNQIHILMTVTKVNSMVSLVGNRKERIYIYPWLEGAIIARYRSYLYDNSCYSCFAVVISSSKLYRIRTYIPSTRCPGKLN